MNQAAGANVQAPGGGGGRTPFPQPPPPNPNEHPVRESMKCPVCLDLLRRPVVMKCGHTICHGHVPDGTPRLQCSVCQKQNTIPPGGFQENRIVTDLLNMGAANLADPNYQLRNDIENLIREVANAQAGVANTNSLRQFARNRQNFEQHYLALRQELDRQYNQAKTAMSNHLRAMRHFIRTEEDRQRPTLEKHRTDLGLLRQTLQRLDVTPAQAQTISDEFTALTPQVTATIALVVAAENRVTNNLMPDQYNDFINLEVR